MTPTGAVPISRYIPDVDTMITSENTTAIAGTEPLGNNCSDTVLGISKADIQYVYVHYMAVTCVVGLTGNCMVWVLIQTNRTLRKIASNVYLLALSVCSSIFLVTLLVFFYQVG